MSILSPLQLCLLFPGHTSSRLEGYMHQYMYACPTESPSLHASPPSQKLCGNMCIPMQPCVHVPSSLIWSHTLVRRCTCISTCMNANITHRSVPPPLHSCILIHASLCSPCECPNHPSSSPTPLSEAINVSVHACMYTLLLTSVPSCFLSYA